METEYLWIRYLSGLLNNFNSTDKQTIYTLEDSIFLSIKRRMTLIQPPRDFVRVNWSNVYKTFCAKSAHSKCSVIIKIIWVILLWCLHSYLLFLGKFSIPLYSFPFQFLIRHCVLFIALCFLVIKNRCFSYEISLLPSRLGERKLRCQRWQNVWKFLSEEAAFSPFSLPIY